MQQQKSLSERAANKKNARGVSAVVAAVLFGVVGLCALLAAVSEEALSKKGMDLRELGVPPAWFLERALSLAPGIGLEKLALKKLILQEESSEAEAPEKESPEEEATQEEASEEEAIDEEASAEEKSEEEVPFEGVGQKEIPAEPPLEAGAPAAKIAAPKKPAKRPAARRLASVREPVRARTQEKDLGSDEHDFDEGLESHPEAEVASKPKLLQPAGKARGEPSLEDTSSGAPTVAEQEEPWGKQLLLSVPRLGLQDVLVGDSTEPAYLDREGIMHLSGSSFPSAPASNTYIAGHAEGYSTSRVPHAFRNLKDLKEGDDISLRDASGKTYHYRVYERLLVDPNDYWVTKPVRGGKIVSLQTCFPAPTFEKRLVVRGKLLRE